MIYHSRQTSRRRFLTTFARTSGMFFGAAAIDPVARVFAQTSSADRNVSVTKMEVLTAGVTARTNWIMVRLTASNGVTGLGEASLGSQTELRELAEFYRLVEGESPFDINQYRSRGWPRASAGDGALATAFSAIEQALWDIVGKSLDVPLYQLFGGKLRDSLPVYANINRATTERTPEGFAAGALEAKSAGFTAIKAAPFDGFPSLTASTAEVNAARKLGVDCVFAMREAVGDDVAIKIDAHSFFDVALSIDVARELEQANLSWFEEPVAPTLVEDTRTIYAAIKQTLAGGEFLFGIDGFAPLCYPRAVDIIMPDVKHCGGLLEALRIAALADSAKILVSPHNPSGPVSTAASIAICAAIPNFSILEYQLGEAAWRGTLIEPAETFVNGAIAVNDRPGIGITLNEAVLAQHLIN